MQLEVIFVLYLLFFRIAIISAGVVSIVLGYRLFCHGIDNTTKGTSLDSSIAGMKFKLQNAAPGTVFAAFGVIIISAMLLSSPPSYEAAVENRQISTQEGEEQGEITESRSSIKLRSAIGGISKALEKAQVYEEKGEHSKAISVYISALNKLEEDQNISKLVNNLAWRYFKAGENLEEALTLSRFASIYLPNTAEYLFTEAEILLKLGDKNKALEIMKKAVALDGRLTGQLPRFENE